MEIIHNQHKLDVVDVSLHIILAVLLKNHKSLKINGNVLNVETFIWILFIRLNKNLYKHITKHKIFFNILIKLNFILI